MGGSNDHWGTVAAAPHATEGPEIRRQRCGCAVASESGGGRRCREYSEEDFRDEGLDFSRGNFTDRIMDRYKSLIIAVVLTTPFFLTGTARGLDINNAVWVDLSEGATTCGEFIAQPGMRAVRMEWVLGYISGRNRQANSPRERSIGSSFSQPATVIGWLQSYCRVHGLGTLTEAADDLRADFQRHEGN